ncbi:NADPH-dependent FMN reductase-like [Dillenia turbinata]|uniref:NAD(P)H dehydrogenase (quinone) n=1 Tax=Dillenia turbinata TaxID=194707 RepID=A0AAN8WDA0_9MAGN
MGKGGVCIPSKSKPPLVAASSDHDHPNPETNEINSLSFEFDDQTPNSVEIESEVLHQPVRNFRIFIVFYSMYGHVELLAKRMKKGVDKIDGVEGVLFRVPETMSSEVLKQMRVPVKGDEIPLITADQLAEADGWLFGFPIRYGFMSAQMKAFFDSTAELWQEQKLAGVPAGFFIGLLVCFCYPTANYCSDLADMAFEFRAISLVAFKCLISGKERLIGVQNVVRSEEVVMLTMSSNFCCSWTAITQLAHHGMIYVPIGYSFGAGMFMMDSLRGGTPYGAGVFSYEELGMNVELRIPIAGKQ